MSEMIEVYEGFSRFSPVKLNLKEARYTEFYMSIAYTAAKLSFAKRRTVGCIAVKNDNIIGFGFNGTPAGCDNECEDEEGNTLPNVVHAEENLLKKIAALQKVETLAEVDLDGVSLFITKEPCIHCAELISNTKGIKDIYYCENSVSKPLEGVKHLYKTPFNTQTFRMELPC